MSLYVWHHIPDAATARTRNHTSLNRVTLLSTRTALISLSIFPFPPDNHMLQI